MTKGDIAWKTSERWTISILFIYTCIFFLSFYSSIRLIVGLKKKKKKMSRNKWDREQGDPIESWSDKGDGEDDANNK